MSTTTSAEPVSTVTVSLRMRPSVVRTVGGAGASSHPGAGARLASRRMTDARGPVTTTIEDGVAVLRFDDGKANVLSFAAIDSFSAALDRAEAEAQSVCIVGREGKLCAGFDLSVMSAGMDAAQELVAAGGELLMRIYQHPQPVVAAVTGHALAAGALLVLSCDVRIGADVPGQDRAQRDLDRHAAAPVRHRAGRGPARPPGAGRGHAGGPGLRPAGGRGGRLPRLGWCRSTRSRPRPSPRRAASAPTARRAYAQTKEVLRAGTRSSVSARAARPTWPASPSSRRAERPSASPPRGSAAAPSHRCRSGRPR